MSLTYGFYNSVNGDRKYDATQVASMFDGLIIDGVFASIGTAFSVKASAGLTVNVGIGKAWFNHTWTINDSEMPLLAPESEVLLDRIDAVVLEVNSSEAVRANDIKFIKGTPASYPERPKMVNDTFVHQYPLCFIYRKAASTEIKQADITPMIGSAETPFVAAILKTLSLEELLGKWQDELDQFVLRKQREFDTWFATKKSELTAEHQALQQWITNEQNGYNTWLTDMKAKVTADLQAELDAFNQWEAARQNEFTTWSTQQRDQYTQWSTTQQKDFTAWFDNVKGQLSTDSAGHLQVQHDNLKQEVNQTVIRLTAQVNNTVNKESIKRILMIGFVDGQKDISEDGTVITSTASDGHKLVKTFTNGFGTLTTVYSSPTGVEIARSVKNFNEDGTLINTTVTYAK